MSAPLLVPDSGPLIALARVDLLHLPALLFSQVLVPIAVWDEVLRQPSEDERTRLQAALASGHLSLPAENGPPPAALVDPRLGAGERAAIGLALAHAAQVLIDERRGRQAAADAGLRVVGTVGLLARGRQLGAIGPVRRVIETLRASGYYLAESLTQPVLAALGE
jgi:predicted nucleic acid-binding protein